MHWPDDEINEDQKAAIFAKGYLITFNFVLIDFLFTWQQPGKDESGSGKEAFGVALNFQFPLAMDICSSLMNRL